MQETKILEYADQQAKRSPAFRRFFRTKKSLPTKKTYTYQLRNFAKISKLGNNPDWDKLVETPKKEINIMVEDFLDELERRGVKGSSMKSAIAAITLFFLMNDVEWSKKRILETIKDDEGKTGGGVPITTPEIARMLENTKSLRTKALVHFFASTGCRPGALVDPVLRIKQLETIENCYAVRIYDESNEEYYAFLIPEAKNALDAYLEKRRQNGETITDESAVFASTPGSTAKEDHLQLKQVQKLLTNLTKMSGIKRTKIDRKRFDKAIIYQFRKRFNGILKMNNNVNSNIAEKLMAHKNGLDGVYLKPTKEQCFAEFKKAIPDLTVDPRNRQAYRIQELEKENDRIRDLEIVVDNMKNAYADYIEIDGHKKIADKLREINLRRPDDIKELQEVL